MAITWGPEVSNSYAGAVRLGWEKVSQTYDNGSKLTAASTELRYTYRVYMQSRGTLQSPTNTLYGDGEAIYNYSKPFAFDTTGTSLTAWHSSHIRLIDTHTDRFKLQYGQSITETGYWWASGIAGSSSTPRTAFFNVYVPARPYTAPAAPSGVQVTRSSDTRHGINWSRNSPNSASAPYVQQTIQRSSDLDPTWRTVATVGNVPSWTDTTTTSGRRYQWRVSAKNSGGSSTWAYSPTVYTTPSAPSNVRATRQGQDIVVSWTKSPSPHTRSRIAYRQEGGAWQYPGWTSTGTSYVIKSPDPSKPLQYAVLAEAESQGATLSSGYAWSNVVQLLTPPAAPTGMDPLVADAADEVAVTWQYGSLDSSNQSAYELRWRPLGASSWNSVPRTSSGVSKHVFAAGVLEPGTIEWQVRTWGAHADPSQWSTPQLTRIAQAPSVTLNRPEPGVLAASRVAPQWVFFDPEGEGQAQWRLTITDDQGSEVWSGFGRSTTVARPDVTLEDGRAYTFTVTAQAASGLWSEPDVVTVQVQYPPPPQGGLTAEWLPDSAAVMLTVSVPAAGSGEAAAVSAEIWRSVDGAPWSLFAGGLPLDTALVDPTPHTSAVTAYKIVTVSDLPSTAEAPPVLVSPDPRGWVWLNAGPGWSQQVKMRDNARLGMKYARAAERHHMAGSALPISIRGQEVDSSIDVSVRLAPNPDGGATWAELREFIANAEEPILYRDAKGHRLFVSIPEVSGSAERIVETASFTAYEIDHEEVTGE